MCFKPITTSTIAHTPLCELPKENSSSSTSSKEHHPPSLLTSSTPQQQHTSCSSFKEVKVLYYNNSNNHNNTFIEGKVLYSNELSPSQQRTPPQHPIILQSATFKPITKAIHKKSLITNNISCTCSKTKCLKKYCECLANNQYCVNCNCVDCHNTPQFQKEKAKENVEVITCTCTKSNCNKKYCECYKSGKACNSNCRCLNCQNKCKECIGHKEDDAFMKEWNKRKIQQQHHQQQQQLQQCQMRNGFVMERISVFVNKGEICVTQETVCNEDEDREEMIIGNKRYREDKDKL
jgi:hypothetical protein